MGLGLLFAGYITLLTFKVLPPVLVVGAYLMYTSFKKMSGYGKEFVNAKISAAVFGVYCTAYSVLWISELAFSYPAVLKNPVFALCESICYTGLLIYLHVTLLSALEALCTSCGYEKGVKRAKFSKVLMTTFAFLAVLAAILSALGVKSYVPLAELIAQTAWFIYTAVLIYGCYMHIATDEMIAEDEKLEKERINKLSEKAAKRNNKGGR